MRNQARRMEMLDDPTLTFAAIVVGVLNLIILLILLGIYLSSYRKIKSNFTVGLMVFTGLLMLQNLLFIIFLVIKEGFRGPGMGVPVLMFNLTQLAALIVLLKISWD